MQDLFNSAKMFVSEMFEGNQAKDFTYHNLNHALEVVDNVVEIGKNSDLNESEINILKLAAIFHDVGWITDLNNHEKKSGEIASKFLSSYGLEQSEIMKVLDLIYITDLKMTPTTLPQMVLRDSDILHIGQKGFYSKSQLLRSEKNVLKNKVFSELEWVESNLDFISSNNFYTEYAKANYEQKRLKNILKLKTKRDELMDEIKTTEFSKSDLVKETKKEKKEKNAGRGVETMFRNTIRTHVEFSTMADSKANILISINTLLLTAVAAFLVKSLDTNSHLIIPTIVLVLTALTTLVITISVTRPKITSGKFTTEDVEKRNVNLMFFGNFCKMDLKTFEWGMTEMINDSDFLYSNMIQDYFHLGKVLGDKYSKLRLAYSIFMYGIIISVIAFGVAVFLSTQQTSLAL
ncbi:MAG: Pycsar system effector family protein [Ignavibacteriaceae bacterium]